MGSPRGHHWIVFILLQQVLFKLGLLYGSKVNRMLFCNIDPGRIISENVLAYAVHDGYPRTNINTGSSHSRFEAWRQLPARNGCWVLRPDRQLLKNLGKVYLFRGAVFLVGVANSYSVQRPSCKKLLNLSRNEARVPGIWRCFQV